MRLPQRPLRRRATDRHRRVFFEPLEDRSLLAAMITVNSTLDNNTRDDVLTLREAILINNRSLAVGSLSATEQSQVSGTPTASDTDGIGFNIPGSGVRTISVTTQLPSVTDPATIDGYTQPGASPNTNAIDDPDPTKRGFNGMLLIQLLSSGSALDCLVVTASNSTVRGLVINGFLSSGIVVGGSGNVIEGNLIGTNASGTSASANFVAGVHIESSNHRIGGTAPASRNVLSGNGRYGVLIDGTGSSNNVIVGNFVGVDATGAVAIGNGISGIHLEGANQNVIGGIAAGSRNIVSANGEVGGGNGIDLFDSSNFNTVQGNYVGIDITGMKPLGNMQVGIGIYSSNNNLIGGTTTAARNVVADSKTSSGISLSLSSANTVQGNYVGTDASGSRNLGNALDGVDLFDRDTNNTIGGTAAGSGNRIAYNRANGVRVRGETVSLSNVILGNSIYSNSGLGIELGGLRNSVGDGVTANDTGDADAGPNHLQNFPEMQSATLSGSLLTVQYVVPSSTANAAYPLRIEFFGTDSAGQEGQVLFGSDSYTAAEAGLPRTVTFDPTAIFPAGVRMVATATDNNGNTSEFSSNITIQAAPCSLVVTTTSDTVDDNDGVTSLREAILCANNTANVNRDGNPGSDPDPISFSIPGSGVKTINLTSVLPTINYPVFIDGYTQPGAAANTDPLAFNGTLLIELNGASVTGSGALRLQGASSGSTIRGLVINRASVAGIDINNVSNTRIEGNLIGTSAAGIASLPNGQGIRILANSSTSNANNTIIGGPLPAARNVISGNNSAGIMLSGISAHPVVGTVIQGNLIGTDVTGSVALGNSQGVYAASNTGETLIGGSGLGEGNVISGNRFEGIALGGGQNTCTGAVLLGTTSMGNIVRGNKIGTDITGTLSLGNLMNGISVGFDANSSQIIGGTGTGEGNVIAYNGLHGVGVLQSHAAVFGNWMFSNGQQGIHLGTGCAASVNDTDDPDTGPNNRQNYPVLNSAILDDRKLSVQYAVPSSILNAAYPLHIEFYKADPDGQEGQTFLGFVTYTTSEAQTTKTASFTPAVAVAIGDKMVATATDSAGNTSEFSASISIQPASPVNHAPSGTDNTITLAEDSVYVIGPGEFGFRDSLDAPANALAAVRITTLPTKGVLTNLDEPVVAGQVIPVTALQQASLRYFPPAGASGSPLTSFTFQVQDNGGTANGGVDLDPTPNSIAINVLPLNDPPTGTNGTLTLAEDSVYAVGPGEFGFKDSLDAPPNAFLAVKITTLPGQGVLKNFGEPVTEGQLIPAAELQLASLRYFPPADAAGSPLTSFTFQVQDNGGTANGGEDLDPTPNVLSIVVTPENDAPVAENDPYTTAEDTPLVVPAPGVLMNDKDIDSAALTAVITSLPAHGSLTLDLAGNFRYLPNRNYNGPDSFTYRASDTQATSNTATVSLTVTPVNDAPMVMLNPIEPTFEGSVLVVAGGFGDPDAGDSWTATIDLGDGHGELPLAVGPNRRFELSHAYLDNGAFTITVRVRDAAGAVGSASRVVNVMNVAPQSLDLHGPAAASRGQQVVFAGSFFDPGLADTSSGVIDWGDGQSTPLVFAPGSLIKQFSAAHTFARSGVFEVRVQVQDDDGGLATQSAFITVTGTSGTSLREGVLELAGSTGNDNIALTLSGKRIVVNATYGQKYDNQSFALAGIQRIVAYLDDGNDILKVDAKIRTQLLVDGGAGNDKLTAGGGPAVLNGGEGSDLLYGGSGRDVLIGGGGRDQLWGYGATDLVIAGRTSYDDDAAALSAILNEWKSSRGLGTRINNVRNGSGPVLGGTGVFLKPQVTAFDDADVDLVMGGGDSDWFILQSGRDTTKDKVKGERLN